MADDQSAAPEAEEGEAPKKGGKGMLLGIVGAVALGGGGFFAAYSGMLPIGGAPPASEGAKPEPEPKAMAASGPVTFLPVDKIVVSLGRSARATHLQFGAQLEIEPGTEEEITNLMPRILDVLNTYLRAVDERELESPSAMLRLRAQMLRRVQIVTGEEKVKDLLVTEFVLN